MQIFSVTIHILSKLTKDNFLWIGLIYTEGKLIEGGGAEGLVSRGGGRFGKQGGAEGLVSFFFRLHLLFPIFFRSHSLT